MPGTWLGTGNETHMVLVPWAQESIILSAVPGGQFSFASPKELDECCLPFDERAPVPETYTPQKAFGKPQPGLNNDLSF